MDNLIQNSIMSKDQIFLIVQLMQLNHLRFGVQSKLKKLLMMMQQSSIQCKQKNSLLNTLRLPAGRPLREKKNYFHN